MIRTLLVTLLIAMAGVFSVSAHGDKGKSHEQMFMEIQEFKMKYLAKEMDLSDEQKQKFFDLYHEMTAKRRECMKPARQLEKKLKNAENPTEADYKAASEAMAKAKSEDAAIEKEYIQKFSTFLSGKQIYKMKEAEEEFRKKMEEMRRNNYSKSKGKDKK